MRVDGRTAFFGALLLVTFAPLLAIPALGPWAHGLPGLEVLILLTGTGHVASTLYVFTDRELAPVVRGHVGRFLLMPLVLAAALGLAAHLGEALWRHVFLAFFVWQMHHYQRQNMGLIAFACRGAGSGPPPRHMGLVMNLTVVAGVAGVVSRGVLLPHTALHAYAEPLYVLALGVYGLALGVFGWVLAREPRLRAAPLPLAFSCATALFFVPALLAGDALVVFWSYAIAHGAQYLIFMLVLSVRPPRVGPLVALGLATCGGLVTLTWVNATPALFGAYYGFVCGHFLIDARLWRMREQPQRELVGGRFAFLSPRPAPVPAPGVVAAERA